MTSRGAWLRSSLALAFVAGCTSGANAKSMPDTGTRPATHVDSDADDSMGDDAATDDSGDVEAGASDDASESDDTAEPDDDSDTVDDGGAPTPLPDAAVDSGKPTIGGGGGPGGGGGW